MTLAEGAVHEVLRFDALLMIGVYGEGHEGCAMNEPVALIGAGALGTVLGYHLAAAGRPVVVCGRTEVDRLAVTFDEDEPRGQPVKWVAAPEKLPAVRWAVLATKIGATAEVADWLARLPADGGVLVAQNGVDQRERVGAFTAAKAVPALAYLNCERLGPGHSLTRRTGRGIVVPDDDGGRAVAGLYEGSGLIVDVMADFSTAVWEKLVVNVVTNSLTALTGRRMEMLGDPDLRALALELAAETAAVARADGAALTVERAHGVVEWIAGIDPQLPTSMLQDRWAGRPLEHDGLLGPVVSRGEQHGVPTPVTTTVLRLLRGLR
ncbi:2-dehydropantoate 2-reductase [Amycolatopsis acidicola]|uniref:2-dehydropantoate 2-reductase n=1 Tax=Amycolatopsis acidicola TaxID=2596893 RepID=A0A5N0V5A2_9PSEU|nr:2-dehydropantoate 2-reductase [Amycolatopsis acidicola]